MVQPFNRHRLTGALLIGTLLSGCETRKPVAATAASQAAVVSKLAPDTVAPGQPMPPDTAARIANQPSETGDVAALHEPFEEIKKVAPGLLVVISSIRPADTAIIRDRSDLSVVLSIKRNNKILYRDTTNDGWAYDLNFMPPGVRKLYPLWVPTGGGNGELLVAFSNRPSKELARRFYIRHNRIARVDTLLTFNGPAKDWDQDGRLEYSGIEDSGEVWDDEQGHRRIAYSPVLYYEIRPGGLVLDSALTKRKAQADYGVFQGFHYAGNPGVLFSKLPKSSRMRQP